MVAVRQVRVAASLPCYSATNVDEQRGRGVFERSIQVLDLWSNQHPWELVILKRSVHMRVVVGHRACCWAQIAHSSVA